MNIIKVLRKLCYCSLFALLFNNTTVFAQDEFNTASGNLFNLSLHTEIGQIDNFLFANQNKQNTTFIVLSPSLALQTQFDNQLLNLEFESEHVK